MFWGFGAVLGSAKQRLYADVVAGDARAGAEGPYAEAGDHGRCGGGLLRGVIVARECGFLGQAEDPFCQGGAPGEMRGLIGVSDPIAHDLA